GGAVHRRPRAGLLHASAGRAAALGFSARALPARGCRVRLVGDARVGPGPPDDRAGRAVRGGVVPAVRGGRLRPALLHAAPGPHPPPPPPPPLPVPPPPPP